MGKTNAHGIISATRSKTHRDETNSIGCTRHCMAASSVARVEEENIAAERVLSVTPDLLTEKAGVTVLLQQQKIVRQKSKHSLLPTHSTLVPRRTSTRAGASDRRKQAPPWISRLQPKATVYTHTHTRVRTTFDLRTLDSETKTTMLPPTQRPALRIQFPQRPPGRRLQEHRAEGVIDRRKVG